MLSKKKQDEIVSCKICYKFRAKKVAQWKFIDKKTDFSNWVTFQVCPDCFNNKIPDDQKYTCFRCKRSGKLCKSMENGKYKYCSYCDTVMLQNRLFDKSTCSFCDKTPIRIMDFRDKLSYDDFLITGQCQDCQDKTSDK
jgi:hypothetical protein